MKVEGSWLIVEGSWLKHSCLFASCFANFFYHEDTRRKKTAQRKYKGIGLKLKVALCLLPIAYCLLPIASLPARKKERSSLTTIMYRNG